MIEIKIIGVGLNSYLLNHLLTFEKHVAFILMDNRFHDEISRLKLIFNLFVFQAKLIGKTSINWINLYGLLSFR